MKIAGLLFLKFANNPLVQRFLYTPWFRKEQAGTVSRPQSAGQRRIAHVEEDNAEGYSYDEDARLRGDLTSPIRNENENGGYLISGAEGGGEHERLLGNGQEWDEGRRDYSDSGFGALQASGLR